MSAEDWPRIDGHTPVEKLSVVIGNMYALAYHAPHLCDIPGCPGPKLVEKLKAAEQMAAAIRESHVGQVGESDACPSCRALAAWDAAK